MATISGGDKVEAFLKEFSKKVSKGAVMRVGFLEGATYASGMPVAAVAAIQEFGAPRAGIPPRPFFRNMIAAKSPNWGKSLGNILKANDYDSEKSLRQMGEGISGQLRQSIIDTNQPALSPVTLMLRKMRTDNPDLVVTGKTVGEAADRVAAGERATGVSTKPLVDIGPEGGTMLNSISYEVEAK